MMGKLCTISWIPPLRHIAKVPVVVIIIIILHIIAIKRVPAVHLVLILVSRIRLLLRKGRRYTAISLGTVFLLLLIKRRVLIEVRPLLLNCLLHIKRLIFTKLLLVLWQLVIMFIERVLLLLRPLVLWMLLWLILKLL